MIDDSETLIYGVCIYVSLVSSSNGSQSHTNNNKSKIMAAVENHATAGGIRSIPLRQAITTRLHSAHLLPYLAPDAAAHPAILPAPFKPPSPDPTIMRSPLRTRHKLTSSSASSVGSDPFNPILVALALQPIDNTGAVFPYASVDSMPRGQWDELGSGAYGRVFLVHLPPTPGSDGAPLIVKESKRSKSRASSSFFRSFLTEIVARRYMEQHVPGVNLDRIVAVYAHESTFGFCMQTSPQRKFGCSLDAFLNPLNLPPDARRGPPSAAAADTSVLYDALVCVAEQLAAMHAAGVAHRDVDVTNVVLEWDYDNRMHAKLIDFGNTQFLPDARGSVVSRLAPMKRVVEQLVERQPHTVNTTLPLFDASNGRAQGIPVAGHMRALDPRVVYEGTAMQCVDLRAADVFAFGCLLAITRNVVTKFSAENGHRGGHVNCREIVRRLRTATYDELRRDFVPVPFTRTDSEYVQHVRLWKLVEGCCNVGCEGARWTMAEVVAYMKMHEEELRHSIRRIGRTRGSAGGGAFR
jgi:hypothetical protein